MPARGGKPKSDAERRRRNPPVLEWQEVSDLEFTGGPELPERGWHADTLDWWDVVSTMPHCVLWKRSDWKFAMDTARVAAKFHSGDMNAAVELRQREKLLGMTLDARRDLRIRYVEPTAEAQPQSIRAIEDYRQRLSG